MTGEWLVHASESKSHFILPQETHFVSACGRIVRLEAEAFKPDDGRMRCQFCTKWTLRRGRTS